ncbi:MAG: alanine:cation symporter family protein, partial [Novibacillus thermophilus]
MEALANVVEVVNGFVWGPVLLILLVGTGIFLTIRLGFIQISQLPYALKLAFSRQQDKSSEGDVSHFQALMTALSATVGTGNIAGVATAVVLGGPGALFWMWFAALFGMAT